MDNPKKIDYRRELILFLSFCVVWFLFRLMGV